MPKKYTTEMVAEYFSQFGCELLSEYVSVKEGLLFKCKCGNIDTISFDCFKKNKNKLCSTCIEKIKREIPTEQRLDYNFVKSYFEEQGCALLESNYVNCKTKMKYICNCGNQDKKDWNKFRAGQRCKKCGDEKVKLEHEKQRYSLDEVSSFFRENGCELLENEYINMHQPLKHICSCGEITEKTFTTFKLFPKCTCNNTNITSKDKLGIRYSDRELVDFFWKFYYESDRYPTTVDFREDMRYPDPYTYTKRFGSWDSFLDTIGVLGSDGWYKYDEEILKELYEIEINKDYIIESLMIQRSWSSISHKALSMGLTRGYKLKYGRDKWKRSDLFRLIKNYYVYLGDVPNKNSFDHLEGFSNSHSFRELGSWNDILLQLGYKPNKNRYVFEDNEIKEITKMYLLGFTGNELADKFNCQASTIYTILKNNNIDLHTRRWSNEQINYLKENYQNKDWLTLLDKLKPFNKEDIVKKSSQLGLVKNPERPYGFSRKMMATNGDECLSEDELIITEFMIQNNINYKDKEVYYRDIIGVQNDVISTKRCDWLLEDNTVIEYFGLISRKQYKEKAEIKIGLCKDYDINLIALYPEDLKNNLQGVKEKLATYIKTSVEV